MSMPKDLKVELRHYGSAPTIAHDVDSINVELNGCTYGFRVRGDGLLVRAEMPIHHALIIVPMGMNSAVLFNRPEPE